MEMTLLRWGCEVVCVESGAEDTVGNEEIVTTDRAN